MQCVFWEAIKTGHNGMAASERHVGAIDDPAFKVVPLTMWTRMTLGE